MSRKSGQALVLWIGVALYALSFFLDAVSEGPGPRTRSNTNPGWLAAIVALVMPLRAASAGLPQNLGNNNPLAWVAMFITGLINPLFIGALVLALRDRQRAVGILRIVLVVMILCCGMVFYAFGLHPLEGFLVWLVGMFLVVSSAEISGALRRRGI